jgi:transposase
MLAGVRLDGPVAAVTYDGAIDAAAFLSYIREFLVPALRPGDGVVLDNLSSNKAAGVAEAVEACGASLLYLPPYSPDLNPIENLWSKVKRHLRQAAARSLDARGETVAAAFDAITPEDCRGFLAGCGYLATGSGALL